MENTKRMVLVDEKMLDLTSALQAKQDMSWNRPSDQSVKSNINKQMKSTLDDQSIPEDVKAKQYRQQLNRFLRTKRKLPTVNDSLDVKRPTVDELLTSSDRSETARL
jgi:protein required for attachment to host cells